MPARHAPTSWPALLLATVLLLGACAPLPPPVTAPAPLPSAIRPASAAPPPETVPPPPSPIVTVAADSTPPTTTPPPAEAQPVATPSAASEEGYLSAATYYARKFEGRRTATGEIYNPKKFTAASNDLPLGSRVRVINPKNGRDVVVRINDRCRKRNFCLIDLSRAAAKELGFFGRGKIRARVIPLLPDAGVPGGEPGS